MLHLRLPPALRQVVREMVGDCRGERLGATGGRKDGRTEGQKEGRSEGWDVGRRDFIKGRDCD